MTKLSLLKQRLADTGSIREKLEIQRAYAPATRLAQQPALLGDDCAALPEAGGGHLLFAAEGLLTDFVARDPWFAGYSAVMVNLSDVAAMGGRALAIVDVLWTTGHRHTEELWAGMLAASEAYGVPIVGGHTTVTHAKADVHLAAAVAGRADKLMTSFDARPGDDVLMAVDLRGAYRGEAPFWNASTTRMPHELRADLELLPTIAERGLCGAAKDISNGGVIGTLVMLLQCSRVAARLDLGSIPRPEQVDLYRWLITFPSYGFLLCAAPDAYEEIRELFEQRGMTCARVGRIEEGVALHLELDAECVEFWRPQDSSLQENRP